MISIKSPLISAWIGQGNFGDELLSYGLRLELQKKNKIDEFVYYESGGYPIYQAESNDCSSVLHNSAKNSFKAALIKRFQSLKGYDSIFFGGGSIFHSETSISWKHSLLKKFRHANPSAFAAAVGVSLGPFSDRHAERAALALLRDFDLVHCRDAASADFSRQVESDVDIVQGRDLAFSVKALRPQFFYSNKIKQRIGFSFILDPKLNEFDRSKHYSKMVAMIDFMTSSGNEVLLVSLYCGAKYSDNLLHQKLYFSAKNKEMVRVVNYASDLGDIVSHISSCSFYVSMRLHGLITAFLSDVPFLALSIHPKVVEFCESVSDMGYNEARANLEMDTAALLALLADAQVCSLKESFSYKVEHDALYLIGSSSLHM